MVVALLKKKKKTKQTDKNPNQNQKTNKLQENLMSSLHLPIQSNGMKYALLNQIKKDWPSPRERGDTNNLFCAKNKQENTSADKSENICSMLIWDSPNLLYTSVLHRA